MRKDITYLCGQCKSSSKDKIAKLEQQIRVMISTRNAERMGEKDKGYGDNFGDIFGDIFK